MARDTDDVPSPADLAAVDCHQNFVAIAGGAYGDLTSLRYLLYLLLLLLCFCAQAVRTE